MALWNFWKKDLSLEDAIQNIVWSEHVQCSFVAEKNSVPKKVTTPVFILPLEYQGEQIVGGFYKNKSLVYSPIGISCRNTLSQCVQFYHLRLDYSAATVRIESVQVPQKDILYLPIQPTPIKADIRHLENNTLRTYLNAPVHLYGVENSPVFFPLMFFFQINNRIYSQGLFQVDDQDPSPFEYKFVSSQNVRGVLQALRRKKYEQPVLSKDQQEKLKKRIVVSLKKKTKPSIPAKEHVILDLEQIVVHLPQAQTERGRLIDNRYELQEPVGIGGSSVVYHAIDIHAGDKSPYKHVAIKLPRQDNEHFQDHIGAVRHLLGISHDNIAGVINVSGRDQASEVYVVMELIDGASLREILQKYHWLEPKVVAEIVKQIAEALDAIKEITPHHDVQPSNVLISSDGVIKIIDFGLKKDSIPTSLEGSLYTPRDKKCVALGTQGYIAPELEPKNGIVPEGTHKSDMYSLGIVLYELLIGHIPKSSDYLRELRSGIPSQFEEIYHALTRLNPDNRWDAKTVKEKIEALQKTHIVTPLQVSVHVKERKIIYTQIPREKITLPTRPQLTLLRQDPPEEKDRHILETEG